MQFYVNAPICSPSRVAISTGTYPQRWRITSYLARRKLNRERGVTFIFSTHDPRVMNRARRVVRVVDGRVERDEARSGPAD